MSVLPFPSFLDDIKEKGFRKAVFEVLDNTVERITAGMNIQDIREALRGDPPSRRPNPRLTPHADAFWMHMRPSYYHQAITGFYPTLRLGFLSTYFFVVEIITGIFLMIFYTPSPQAAYPNMLNILSNVPLGQFMRDLHRLGAEGMVLFVALHTIRTFTTGSYKKPRQFTWFSGMVLMLTTLFLSFSGYLLPWDQLAFWAVTIGTSMAEAAPPEIVGTNVNLLLRGAPDIGAGGLLRFYLLHVFLLPMLTAIFLGVHYYKVILHGHSLPPRLEEVGQDTAKRVPMDKRVYFTPDVITTEVLWVGLTTLIMVVMSIWFFHAPLESHANPQVTPLHTTAPWYFLWLQGMLKLGDKIFFGLVIPTVLLGMFMVWPYLDVTPSRRYAHRRLALTLMCSFCFVMFFLTYMGTGKWGVETSPDQEVVQDLAPMEGVGPARAIPFDELVNGVYCTDDLNTDHALPFVQNIGTAGSVFPDTTQPVTCQAVPEGNLRHVMETFRDDLETRSVGKLINPIGIITISDEQTDLKRMDLKVIWQTPQLDENKQLVRNDDGSVKLVTIEQTVMPTVVATEPAATMEATANATVEAVIATAEATALSATPEATVAPQIIQVPSVQISGKTIFIHRSSEYQDTGH